ncbi:DNRLRE domain-containing protein [Candidatus Woesearchaeota archaeon]|nr:DNRLRE domain-containing protein [Candidatus Woesearchaeota archaeon]MBI4155071.1 DNRLRE domain-containing protein [Candidatus Woesearchaeota archaeon]
MKLIYLFLFLLVFPLAFALTERGSDFEKTCDGNSCTLLLSSTPKYVYEDFVWKSLEEAKSLKNSNFYISYLEKDPKLLVQVDTFNYSSITLSLKVDQFYQSVLLPITVWVPDKTKTTKTGNFKLDYTKIKEISVGTDDSSKSFTSTVSFSLDSILEFGFSSTTIEIKSNSSNWQDKFCGLPPSNTCYDSTYSGCTTCDKVSSKNNTFFYFNYSNIPDLRLSDTVIDSAIASMRGNDNVAPKFVNLTRVTSTWSETDQTIPTFVTWNYYEALPLNSASTWNNWTITNLVQEWVNQTYVNFGFKINKTSNVDGQQYIDSRESATGPYVTITYTLGTTSTTTVAVTTTTSTTSSSTTLPKGYYPLRLTNSSGSFINQNITLLVSHWINITSKSPSLDPADANFTLNITNSTNSQILYNISKSFLENFTLFPYIGLFKINISWPGNLTYYGNSTSFYADVSPMCYASLGESCSICSCAEGLYCSGSVCAQSPGNFPQQGAAAFVSTPETVSGTVNNFWVSLGSIIKKYPWHTLAVIIIFTWTSAFSIGLGKHRGD